MGDNESNIIHTNTTEYFIEDKKYIGTISMSVAYIILYNIIQFIYNVTDVIANMRNNYWFSIQQLQSLL